MKWYWSEALTWITFWAFMGWVAYLFYKMAIAGVFLQ